MFLARCSITIDGGFIGPWIHHEPWSDLRCEVILNVCGSDIEGHTPKSLDMVDAGGGGSEVVLVSAAPSSFSSRVAQGFDLVRFSGGGAEAPLVAHAFDLVRFRGGGSGAWFSSLHFSFFFFLSVLLRLLKRLSIDDFSLSRLPSTEVLRF